MLYLSLCSRCLTFQQSISQQTSQNLADLAGFTGF